MALPNLKLMRLFKRSRVQVLEETHPLDSLHPVCLRAQRMWLLEST